MSPTATRPGHPTAAESRSRHPSGRSPSEARRNRRPPPTYLLLALVITLLTLTGLVMVLSASSVNDLHERGSSWFSFTRQLMWVGLGLAALAVTLRVDYRVWRRLSRPLLAVTLVLLVAVLVPGVGLSVNGSARWLGAGTLRIQPSELAKLAVLIFAADLLSRPKRDVRDLRTSLRPVLLVLSATSVLLLLQPDLGTLVVIATIALVVLFVGGTPLMPLGGLTVIAGSGALAVALQEGYRRDRLLAFLDPWADPLNSGYQTIQSLVGIASGGIAGVGLGASRAKWGFLPYAHTDFIFAILAEELGLVGVATVIALFCALALLGIGAAAAAPDRFGTLLAAGIAGWFTIQAVVNIGAVVGVLPITGMPLPFVSFGGSSLVVSMAASGMLLNVARSAVPAPRAR